MYMKIVFIIFSVIVLLNTEVFAGFMPMPISRYKGKEASNKENLKYESEVKQIANQGVDASRKYEEVAKELDKDQKKEMSKYIREANDPFLKSLGIENIDSKKAIRKYVFLSFSMPDQALKILIKRASEMGYSAVIRGLVDGSMTKTVDRVKGMIDMTKEGVSIDPESFEEFKVTKVPTFVIAEDFGECDAEGKCEQSRYNKVTGNVTLDYAQEYLLKHGEKLWQ